MDSWKKYMKDNEQNLAVEEVEDKVWQHVYKAAVPKKRFFIQNAAGIIKTFFAKHKIYTAYTTRRGTYRLAYALVFLTLIIVSCTYKVKRYSTYGEIISFAVAKNSYLLKEDNANNVFNSFSRIVNPSDAGSFLFLKWVGKEDRDAKEVVEKVRATKGVANVVVSPVRFEYKESLMSSVLSKTLNIELSKPKADNQQIKNKVEDVLAAKGLHAVKILMDEKSKDVLFSIKALEEKQMFPASKDTVITPKPEPNKSRRPDAEEVMKHSFEQMEKSLKVLEDPKWKNDLAQMSAFTEALEKEKLVDNKLPYKLEIKDGEFYINDKKQPAEIRDKFKKYFRNDNYTIINNGDQ